MPVRNMMLPEFMSVSTMATQLQMSRSRFYELVDQGIFLPPVFSLRTRRPMFTRELAELNLLVRQTNRGMDGSPILFNKPRSRSATPGSISRPRRTTQANDHADLVAALGQLGLEEVTSARVDEALRTCYPNGRQGVDEGEVLRRVYRHLRRSVSA